MLLYLLLLLVALVVILTLVILVHTDTAPSMDDFVFTEKFNDLSDEIDHMERTSIASLRRWAKEKPNSPALWFKPIPGTDQFQSVSFREYNENVQSVAKSLLALGIKKGEYNCIMSGNNKEWFYFDLGSMTVNTICAGIYFSSSATQVLYLLNHSEAKIVVVEKKDHFEKVIANLDKLNFLRNIVFLNAQVLDDYLEKNKTELKNANQQPIRLMSWSEFIDIGKDTPQSDVDRVYNNISLDDVGISIYTSGTTGVAKCVQLTFRNLNAATVIANQVVSNTQDPNYTIRNPNNTYISSLPLAHIAERLLSIFLPLDNGYQVYFGESIYTLLKDLQTVRPVIFFGVPRIYEKMKAGMEGKIRESGPVKKTLIEWAMNQVCIYNMLIGTQQKPSFLFSIKVNLIKRYLLKPLKAKIGFDKTSIFGAGSAPIAADVLKFFTGLDMTIINIYGSSESGALGSTMRPNALNFDSVGVPTPGSHVKIAEDGEILIKAPSVMKGYAKDEAATRDTFDNEGYLRTGDVGVLKNGFLKITGRKKEIIMTSNGKNVAPAYFESAMQHDIINASVMIGDKRKYLSALISLDREQLLKWVRDHTTDYGVTKEDVEHMTPDEALQKFYNHPATEAVVEKRVKEVNSAVSDAEQVKKFKILPVSFSIDGGEFTPTLKTRKYFILSKYEKEIDEIYANDHD